MAKEMQMYLAVMQPYFFPYLGYFQLICRSETFVILDDAQFIKGGWIHKNKILDSSGRELEILIPTIRSSNRNQIRALNIHEDFSRAKTLKKIERCYGRASHFREAMALVEPVIMFETNSLVDYLENSIKVLSQHLGASAKFVRASELAIGDFNKPSKRIIEICKQLKAPFYLNLPGGKGIYVSSDFESEEIGLAFLSPKLCEYKQFNPPFRERLSILDPLMHLGIEATAEMTKGGKVEEAG